MEVIKGLLDQCDHRLSFTRKRSNTIFVLERDGKQKKSSLALQVEPEDRFLGSELR